MHRPVPEGMSPAAQTSVDGSFLLTTESAPLPAAIFDEYAVAVWAVAMQALGDEAEADDVVEATFTTFARSPGSLAGSDDPGLLLFATVRRITLDRLRGIDLDAIDIAPPVAVSGQRWRSALALGRMSEIELAATRLRHEHGLRPDAIAYQLGQPPDVVARCAERADQLLGSQLAADSGMFEALRPPNPLLRQRLVGRIGGETACDTSPPEFGTVTTSGPWDDTSELSAGGIEAPDASRSLNGSAASPPGAGRLRGHW